MSFGLSSGGGQVRYALIVDDHATQPLNSFKNNLASVGTQTTKLSRDMTVLNSSFSAGLNPIKNTGNALNQLGTTQKTLSSQAANLGKTFKTNALAIGAAASSVLGLYQNYANLSSAQNAANKSATAATAAQNKVDKLTEKLAQTIAKYGKNSKEAAVVQKDLSVAQERAAQKAESAKIAQDNLNQTMADFGINILPNVILAGGSIVSIFDNISLKGKSLTGIVSKIGSAFTGIGGSGSGLSGLAKGILGIGTAAATSATGLGSLGKAGSSTTGILNGISGAFSGVGKAGSTTTGILNGISGGFTGIGNSSGGAIKGIGGMMDKMKGLGGSILGLDGPMKGLKGNLLGLGSIAAVGIIGVIGVIDDLNKKLKDLKDVSSGALTPTQALGNEFDRWQKFDFTTIEGLASAIIHGIGPGIPLMQSLGSEVKKVAELEKNSGTVKGFLALKQAEYNQRLKEYQDAVDLQLPALIKIAKANLDQAKSDLDLTKAFASKSNALDTLDVAQKKYNDTQAKTNPLVKESTANWKLQTEALQGGTVKNINLASQAYLDVHNAIVKANPEITKNIEQARLADQTHEALSTTVKTESTNFYDLSHTFATITKVVGLTGDGIRHMGDQMVYTTSKTDPFDAGLVKATETVKKADVNFYDLSHTFATIGKPIGVVGEGIKHLAADMIYTTAQTNPFSGALVKAANTLPLLNKANKEYADRVAAANKIIKEQKDAIADLNAEDNKLIMTFGGLNKSTLLNTEVRAKLLEISNKQKDGHKAEELAILDLAAANDVYSSGLANLASQEGDQVTQMNNLLAMSINYTSALDDQAKNQKLISEGFRDGIIQAKGFFDNLVKGTEQDAIFNASLATGVTQLGIHSNLLAFSSGKMQELIKTTYEQSQGFRTLSLESAESTKFLKDMILINSTLSDAMVEGTRAANDWAITMIHDVQSTKSQHTQLVQLTADMLGLSVPIGATDDALKKAMTTFRQTEDAGRALAQMMTDKLAPSFERVSGLIQSKDMKELKNNLKDLELPKGFNKDLDDAFKPLRGAAQHARELGNAMDILVTAGVNMSKKDLTGNMKAFGKELDSISKIKGTSKPVDAILMSLKTMSPEQLGKHTESMQFLVDTINKFGTLPKDKAKEFIDMYNKEVPMMGPASTTAAQGVDTLAASLLKIAESNFDPSKFIPSTKAPHTFKDPSLSGSADKGTIQKVTIQLDNSAALRANAFLAKAIDNLSKRQPFINLSNSIGIKANAFLAKAIDNLSKRKPFINLSNAVALKTNAFLAKAIDNLSKRKPFINLSNTEAFKRIDATFKKIMSLEKAQPTITVKVKYDTSNKPKATLSSRFDSKADSSTNFSKADSGMIVENHIHIMDQDIVRRIKAQQGRNRWSMGA